MTAAKFLLVAALLAGVTWKYGLDAVNAHLVTALPIKYVRTEGVFQYLRKDEIKSALEPLVKTGFFNADMQIIHAAVSTLPWVESVTVKRVWPDAIDIKVHERKPFVRWGEKSLISQHGVVFTPRSIEPFEDLMVVTGPDQQHIKVLEIMKGVKTTLADQSLELAEFSVNNRWAWKLKLANGLEILLGRNEQLKKLQRFLKTLTVLQQEQVDAMEVVDLRYPNGYAVSWKAGTPEFDWKAIASGSPQSTITSTQKGNTE
jgi:cell division protein FtsQ